MSVELTIEATQRAQQRQEPNRTTRAQNRPRSEDRTAQTLERWTWRHEHVQAAAFVPPGHRRPKRAATWLADTLAQLERSGLRADHRATLAAVASELARTADYDTMASRPTWEGLQTRTGRCRSTVALALAALIDNGLLVRAEHGSTARYRKHGDTREGTRAAAYVLIEPEPVTEDKQNRTPSEPPKNQKPHTRATTSDVDNPEWSATRAPVASDQHLDAAAALRRVCPPARRLSAKHLRSLCRAFWTAGWSPSDVVHALDHTPDRRPRGIAYATSDIRSPRAWITHRLADWTDQTGEPIRSRTQQNLDERNRIAAGRAERKHAHNATTPGSNHPNGGSRSATARHTVNAPPTERDR